MVHRNPLVEHIALAAPETLLLRNGLQVFQDAAAQVVDLLEALVLQIGRGLFAANAAGAEHGNGALLLTLELAGHVVGKLAKILRAG